MDPKIFPFGQNFTPKKLPRTPPSVKYKSGTIPLGYYYYQGTGILMKPKICIYLLVTDVTDSKKAITSMRVELSGTKHD